ncbi:MAG: hypothetical protein ACR2M3_00450 [Thermomicrobiales bacterium]
MAPTLADALALRESSTLPLLDCLIAHLRGLRLLLVLDNFEQVVEAAPTVAALTVGCPHLRVLVTSRTPLRLAGERRFPLPPLALPDVAHTPDRAALLRYAAPALYVERAIAVAPSFRVTDADAPPWRRSAVGSTGSRWPSNSPPPACALYTRALAAARTQMDGAAWAVAWTTGRARGAEVVADALEEADTAIGGEQ